MNANSLYPVVYDLSEAEYSSQNSTSSSRFCSGGGVDYSFQELLSQEPFPMSLYDVQLLGRDKPKRSGIRRSRSPSLQLTSAAKLTREDVDSRNDFDEPVADGRRIAFDDCFVLTRQVSLSPPFSTNLVLVTTHITNELCLNHDRSTKVSFPSFGSVCTEQLVYDMQSR
jgi:hypothetical protein